MNFHQLSVSRNNCSIIKCIIIKCTCLSVALGTGLAPRLNDHIGGRGIPLRRISGSLYITM